MHSLLCFVYISTSEDDLCLLPIFPPSFSVPCASGSRLWRYTWAKKFVLTTRAKESLPNDELRNESHSSAGESELVRDKGVTSLKYVSIPIAQDTSSRSQLFLLTRMTMPFNKAGASSITGTKISLTAQYLLDRYRSGLKNATMTYSSVPSPTRFVVPRLALTSSLELKHFAGFSHLLELRW
jgi:hypothetical protein